MVYAKLVIELIKLAMFIFGTILKYRLEEAHRLNERMATLRQLLADERNGLGEVANEGDYLDNLDWEKKQRYVAYRNGVSEILTMGGGIVEMRQTKILGMHVRVGNHEEELIEVILKSIGIAEKSIIIAKILAEEYG